MCALVDEAGSGVWTSMLRWEVNGDSSGGYVIPGVLAMRSITLWVELARAAVEFGPEAARG
jgi:hypothetical protein